MGFIQLDQKNIKDEHICCAFSGKKDAVGYQLKKDWLAGEFDNGYRFIRLNERAKVFIEYGPAEKSWNPIVAPNYYVLGCFWVAGQYKGQGYGKQLMELALEEAQKNKKDGLVAIVGTKKFGFMSDTKWLLSQGFVEVDKLPYGFSLLVKKINTKAADPCFAPSVIRQEVPNKSGLVAYYTDRCPFTDGLVPTQLVESAKKRGLPLKIIKFESVEQAQKSPTPNTIFSLFYNGKFMTTDMSCCMDSRFDKVTNIKI